MADEVMTGASHLDAIVPEFWSAAFYPTLLEALPFNDIISRDYEGEIADLGDTVNIPSIPQFDAAQELAEDAKADADGVTVSKTQLVIDKQVVKDFILTKKGMRQSIDAQMKLRDLALHSIMKKMQSIIIALIVPSASAPDHTIAFDSGTTLALADILEAKELLDGADVPDVGQRQMVLGVAQQNDLFNITGFVSRDYIANANAMASGSVSSPLLGFNVKWTSELGNVAYLFDPLFMQMAVQENPAVEMFPLGADGARGMRVNMTTLFGVKQVSNVRVVQIG